MPMQMFTCSLCDQPTASDGERYMVPLGDDPLSTAVQVCYRCFSTVKSYETMKSLEAGEYDAVFDREGG